MFCFGLKSPVDPPCALHELSVLSRLLWVGRRSRSVKLERILEPVLCLELSLLVFLDQAGITQLSWQMSSR